MKLAYLVPWDYKAALSVDNASHAHCFLYFTICLPKTQEMLFPWGLPLSESQAVHKD